MLKTTANDCILAQVELNFITNWTIKPNLHNWYVEWEWLSLTWAKLISKKGEQNIQTIIWYNNIANKYQLTNIHQWSDILQFSLIMCRFDINKLVKLNTLAWIEVK